MFYCQCYYGKPEEEEKSGRDNHVKLHNHVHLLAVCRAKMGVKLIEKVKETYCKST